MEPIYTGVRPTCGHIVAAVVDDAESKKDTAKTLANWIKRGLTIVRLETELQGEAAKENWCGCHCKESPHYKPELGEVPR